MKPTFSNLRNIALGLCLTQVVSAANAQEVVVKINDKASTSKDSIERILDRVMANINKDNKADIETNKQVIICDTLSPRVLPKKPDIIEPIKGKNNIKYSTLSF